MNHQDDIYKVNENTLRVHTKDMKTDIGRVAAIRKFAVMVLEEDAIKNEGRLIELLNIEIQAMRDMILKLGPAVQAIPPPVFDTLPSYISACEEILQRIKHRKRPIGFSSLDEESS